jgi:hypothetical protein
MMSRKGACTQVNEEEWKREEDGTEGRVVKKRVHRITKRKEKQEDGSEERVGESVYTD